MLRNLKDYWIPLIIGGAGMTGIGGYGLASYLNSNKGNPSSKFSLQIPESFTSRGKNIQIVAEHADNLDSEVPSCKKWTQKDNELIKESLSPESCENFSNKILKEEKINKKPKMLLRIERAKIQEFLGENYISIKSEEDLRRKDWNCERKDSIQKEKIILNCL